MALDWWITISHKTYIGLLSGYLSELVLENYMDVTDKISPSTDEFKTDIIFLGLSTLQTLSIIRRNLPPEGKLYTD